MVYISNEIKEVNGQIIKLEADLSISKNVNNKLTERIADLECKCWMNHQYSRRECLELVGVPLSVKSGFISSVIATTILIIFPCRIPLKIGIQCRKMFFTFLSESSADNPLHIPPSNNEFNPFLHS